MGHYDDCYEESDRKHREYTEQRLNTKSKNIKRAIKDQGIEMVLSRIINGDKFG